MSCGDADDDSDLDLIALVNEKTPALEQVLLCLTPTFCE